jgi:DNA anti-recombination protein RmuC
MKPFYLVVPLVALLLLGVLNYNHQKTYKQDIEAKAARVKLEKETRAHEEAAAREAAMQEALQAQEKRRREREAKEKLDQAAQQERQLALEAREQARREIEKLTRLIERGQKQLQEETEALERLQARKKSYQDRRGFLDQYLAQSRANLKKLQSVLVKVMPLEAASPAATPTAPSKS